MAREFIDLKLYFLKAEKEIEFRYTPDEKLRETIGPLFVDAAGLMFHPQNTENTRNLFLFPSKCIESGNILLVR